MNEIDDEFCCYGENTPPANKVRPNREKIISNVNNKYFEAFTIQPKEWGVLKREIWAEIYNYIIPNFAAIESVVKAHKVNEHPYQEIVLENLKAKGLITKIEGEKDKLRLIKKYIISIYLMLRDPPAYPSDIYQIAALEYKHIKDITEHLKIELPKKRKGKPIDPAILNSIKEELKKQIIKYNSGSKYRSISEIARFLGLNQSVISYYGKKYYPKEYDEIWGRDYDEWIIDDETWAALDSRIKTEINKYKNNFKPSTISSIANDFKARLGISSIRKYIIKNYPSYYKIIWETDYSLSSDEFNLLTARLNSEVIKEFPDSLTSIGEDLNISYDTVRYYAMKWFKDKYDKLWGKGRLTEFEIETIQDRIHQEINKYQSYKEPVIRYDNFDKRLIITKDRTLKPSSLTKIADDFGKSRETIQRYARDTDLDSYEKIWGKPRISGETRNSIISDILDFNSRLSMSRIASKHGVHTSSVSKISIEEVQPNYDGYDHKERFPQDKYQLLGTELHIIINYIATASLSKHGISLFTEIYHNGYRMDFLLPLPKRQMFYEKIIKNNERRKALYNEIGIDFRKDFDIVVDHTSYISEKNVNDKIRKYHSLEKFTLINITRWYDKKYFHPIIHTRIKNAVVIRHDIFADLFGLEDNFLRDFEIAIGLNYAYDLDGMISFKERMVKKYFKLGYNEYKRFINNL